MSTTPGKNRPKLLEACGLEIEYAVVDTETLAIRPIVDRVLIDPQGQISDEVEIGSSVWGNELAAHVIEVKPPAPVACPSDLNPAFTQDVRLVNERLRPHQAQLLPTGAHPFMMPAKEASLWPHHYTEIYGAYDRIFGCRTHGWTNLQSTHLNLSFGSDREFARLHSAIRLILPIIPGLCASTPILEGRLTGLCDSRLDVYINNQRKIPAIAGRIIPERVHSQQEYNDLILEPMFKAIAPLDPDGILHGEWLNSRGAIARFDRFAIEIRLIDTQECPAMDITLCELIMNAVRLLTEERFANLSKLDSWDESDLLDILMACVRDGSRTRIANRNYLALFDCTDGPATAAEIWEHIASLTPPGNTSFLDLVLARGTLSERIRRRVGDTPTPESILACYKDLALCLHKGKPFLP